ncbi:MAG: DUF4129 domain-containing protein [Anaerolineae bacterium]
MTILRRLAWALAALFWLTSAPLAHAQSPVALADYISRVDQAIDLVTRAGAQPANARQPLLEQAAALLEGVHTVQLDNGVQMSVDNAGLAQALRSSQDAVDPALARLKALRNSLSTLPTVASAADRARVRDLLNRAPFKDSQDPFWAWLQQQINDYLDRLTQSVAKGIYDWRDLVAIAGLLLVIGVIVFLIWNFRKNAAPEARLPDEENAAAAQTSQAALSRAQQFASAGDYRAAMRELYLATLLLLDERGRIRFDSALTNREYLQAAAREPALAAALTPVVEAFDRTWYGFERVTPDDFLVYQARVEDVRRQAVQS